MRDRLLPLLPTFLPLLLACTEPPTEPAVCAQRTCTAVEDCIDDVCVTRVPEVEGSCVSSEPWSPGSRVFVDNTAAWGLASVAEDGFRISGGDIDGDGYDDLVSRTRDFAEDDPADASTRKVWLLRNAAGAGFEDVTQSSGFLARRFPTSALGRPVEVVVFGDVDNDGDLDAFSGVTDGADESFESNELLLNDGSGQFTLAEKQVFHDSDDVAGPKGATFVDFDRDGRLDLLLAKSGGVGTGNAATQDRLYRQDGEGLFHDVTEERGMLTLSTSDAIAYSEGRAHTRAWGSTACDLNNDGLPELLVPSYGRAPNHLWLAEVVDDEVRFRNRSVASGYAYDERTDWTEDESARCWCKHHRDDEDCATVPEPAYFSCATDEGAFRWNHSTGRLLSRLGGNSATTTCADLDGDGWMDLLTGEIVHWDVGSSSDPAEILFNRGTHDVSFERPGNEATGLLKERPSHRWDDGDMTSAIFDFDNDGRPDILIASSAYNGTRAHLYHQKSDGTFEPVSISDGIDHTSAHGPVVSDFDRDGDLDVVLAHARSRCSETSNHCYPEGHPRFFENDSQPGNWLQLQLSGGEATNGAAIGARVSVEAAGRTQVQEVGGGYGNYGLQHGTTLHFGLGASCEAKVTVRWPDRELFTQTLTLKAGHRYHLRQGEAPAVRALP